MHTRICPLVEIQTGGVDKEEEEEGLSSIKVFMRPGQNVENIENEIGFPYLITRLAVITTVALYNSVAPTLFVRNEIFFFFCATFRVHDPTLVLYPPRLSRTETVLRPVKLYSGQTHKSGQAHLPVISR